MVRRSPPAGTSASTPDEYPAAPPRDLYPTSDIRFVLTEIGKLTATVDRLVSDSKSHGDKLDQIRHQATYIKGFIACAGIALAALVGLVGFFLDSRWTSAIEALKAVVTPK
jgi:HAMP domain-containing protein